MFRRRTLPANDGPRTKGPTGTSMRTPEAGRSMRDPEAGQAMVEFIIVFPLQLVLTCCLMQFALLVIGRIAVDHSAWIAARAALTACQDPDLDPQAEAEAAAEQFLMPVTGRIGGTSGPINYPGWGPMDRSSARNKTTVTIDNESGLKTADRVIARVEHDFYLGIPIANVLTVSASYRFVYFQGWSTGGAAAESKSLSQYGGAPHLTLKASRWIPKPWKDAQ